MLYFKGNKFHIPGFSAQYTLQCMSSLQIRSCKSAPEFSEHTYERLGQLKCQRIIANVWSFVLYSLNSFNVELTKKSIFCRLVWHAPLFLLACILCVYRSNEHVICCKYRFSINYIASWGWFWMVFFLFMRKFCPNFPLLWTLKTSSTIYYFLDDYFASPWRNHVLLCFLNND